MRVKFYALGVLLVAVAMESGCNKAMPPSWNQPGTAARIDQPTSPAGQPPVVGPPRQSSHPGNPAEAPGFAAGRTLRGSNGQTH